LQDSSALFTAHGRGNGGRRPKMRKRKRGWGGLDMVEGRKDTANLQKHCRGKPRWRGSVLRRRNSSAFTIRGRGVWIFTPDSKVLLRDRKIRGEHSSFRNKGKNGNTRSTAEVKQSCSRQKPISTNSHSSGWKGGVQRFRREKQACPERSSRQGLHENRFSGDV